MCLSINEKIHKQRLFFIKPKPLVAKTNIRVVKVLEQISDSYYTPYQGMCVFFDANCVMECKKTTLGLKRQFFSGRNYWIVNEGYHSYVNSLAAEPILMSTSGSLIFNAVIPKGSLYYIGKNGDVVSDQLIILNHCYNGDEYSFHNLTNIETYDQLRTL